MEKVAQRTEAAVEPAAVRRGPEYYAVFAWMAESEGRWTDAAKHWASACGATIGHNRRERYAEAQKRCEEKAQEIADAKAAVADAKAAVADEVTCDGRYCGCRINRDVDEYHEHDGDTYCDSCYQEKFVACAMCAGIFSRDETTVVNDEHYCTDCLDSEFFYCESCEEYHASEDATVVNYTIRNGRSAQRMVCESCLSPYARCNDCSEYWPSDESYLTGGDYYVCRHCYENSYGSCDSCNAVYHTDDLHYNERNDCTYCYACACAPDNDGAIQEYGYKPSPKYKHFNQRNNTVVLSRLHSNRLYLGFELETESPIESADSVASALISRFDADEDIFYCKSDSSLNDGFEIVTHPMTLRVHKLQDYPDMLALLKRSRCKSHDTDTCGLHVHVSKAFFSHTELVKLGLFVYFNKVKLEAFARRTESCFAKFKPLNKSRYQDSAESKDRYEAINFEPWATVEFRLFRGTLNIETLLATLEFCDAVSRFVKTVSACTITNGGGFDAFKTFLTQDGNRKLYKNLLTYLAARGL